MKNPHGVEPTRYRKREESQEGIESHPDYGPIFGYWDIYINEKCNKEDCCWIDNNGNWEYECHPQHKMSLFVNTSVPDESNYFSVLDYEVYTHD